MERRTIKCIILNTAGRGHKHMASNRILLEQQTQTHPAMQCKITCMTKRPHFVGMTLDFTITTTLCRKSWLLKRKQGNYLQERMDIFVDSAGIECMVSVKITKMFDALCLFELKTTDIVDEYICIPSAAEYNLDIQPGFNAQTELFFLTDRKVMPFYKIESYGAQECIFVDKQITFSGKDGTEIMAITEKNTEDIIFEQPLLDCVEVQSHFIVKSKEDVIMPFFTSAMISPPSCQEFFHVFAYIQECIPRREPFMICLRIFNRGGTDVFRVRPFDPVRKIEYMKISPETQEIEKWKAGVFYIKHTGLEAGLQNIGEIEVEKLSYAKCIHIKPKEVFVC